LSYSHLRLYTDIGKIITDDSEYYDMEWNELFVYIGVSIWLGLYILGGNYDVGELEEVITVNPK